MEINWSSLLVYRNFENIKIGDKLFYIITIIVVVVVVVVVSDKIP